MEETSKLGLFDCIGKTDLKSFNYGQVITCHGDLDTFVAGHTQMRQKDHTLIFQHNRLHGVASASITNKTKQK